MILRRFIFAVLWVLVPASVSMVLTFAAQARKSRADVTADVMSLWVLKGCKPGKLC